MRAATLSVVVLLTAMTGLLSAPTAAAGPTEDDFESSLTLVMAGFESRRWTDNNRDDVATAIHFVDCTSNPEVALYRVVNNWPDTQIGERKIAWCLNTNGPWLTWGDQPAGQYYLKITDTRSDSGYLSVDYVHVGW